MTHNRPDYLDRTLKSVLKYVTSFPHGRILLFLWWRLFGSIFCNELHWRTPCKIWTTSGFPSLSVFPLSPDSTKSLLLSCSSTWIFNSLHSTRGGIQWICKVSFPFTLYFNRHTSSFHWSAHGGHCFRYHKQVAEKFPLFVSQVLPISRQWYPLLPLQALLRSRICMLFMRWS